MSSALPTVRCTTRLRDFAMAPARWLARAVHRGAGTIALPLVVTLTCTALWIGRDVRAADPEAHLEPRSSMGGGVHALTIRGESAYLAMGDRLAVADLSVIGAPRVVGQTGLLPGRGRDVAVRDGLVAVALGEAGIAVVDGTDPARPEVVASIDVAARHVAWSSSVLVATGGNALKVVDLRTPERPRLAGLLTVDGMAEHVWIDPEEQGTAWVLVHARSDGGLLTLERIDITDAARPRRISTAALTLGAPRGLAMTDGLVVVTLGSGEMVIFDRIDPTNPAELGRGLVPGAGSGSTSGHVVVEGDRAWVGGITSVAEIDIADPTAMRPLGVLDTRGAVVDLHVEDGRLFIGNVADLVGAKRAYYGMEIMEVSVPGRPGELGVLRDAWNAYGVALGTTASASADAPALRWAAVAAGRAGLRTVDVTDPATPRAIGRYEGQGEFVDVALHGAVAYVADRTAQSAFHVVDVSDPFLPRGIDIVDRPAALASSIVVAEELALLAAGLELEMVVFYDLSDPRDPTWLRTLDVPGRVLDMATASGVLYVVSAAGDGPPEMSVISLAGRSPRLVARSRLDLDRSERGPVAVAAEGRRVLVTGANALLILDASNPRDPLEVGRVPLPHDATAIEAAGGYAVAAGTTISIVDGERADAPVVAADVEWPAEWPEGRGGVVVMGDHVILAHWEAGLAILETRLAPLPTFTPWPTAPPTATPTPSSTPLPSATPEASATPTRPAPSFTPTASPSSTSGATVSAPTWTPAAAATEAPSPSATSGAGTPTTAPATPSPTVAATSTTPAPAAPTPTASSVGRGTPERIWLPVALLETCPPRDRFADVVLVIDASLSMAERTASGVAKIDRAVDAVWTFLDGLRLRTGADRAAIVTFNQRATLTQGLTHDRARILTGLRGIRLSPATRIDRGLERAGAELRSRGRPGTSRAVVLLSDGRADPSAPGVAVSAAAGLRGEGIALYVVGIGPSMDAVTLARMVGRSERFIAAPNPDRLRSVYRALSRRVPCPASAFWGGR